jgi:GTP-binding protein
VGFTVVDTGGIDALPFRGDTDPLAEDSVPFISLIRAQAELAIAEADVIVFLTDAAAGLTPADEEVANILRRSDKPIILAANKAESPRVREAAVEFYALGLDELHLVSALHGQGVADLLDRVVEAQCG